MMMQASTATLTTVDADQRLTRSQSRALGHSARESASRESHGVWEESPDRADPIALLEEQNESRLPWLVPLRHGRMSVSAFTFYRGSAAIMAADLADSPTTGLSVQLGGDAHISNFGAYASPGRDLVIDASDFDETLPGPWEWDLKRLSTSVLIAAQNLGFTSDIARHATLKSVESYATAMADFADEGYLETWRRSQKVDDLTGAAGFSKSEAAHRFARFERRAKARSSLQAVGKLTEVVDGRRVFRHQPPVLARVRDLPPSFGDAEAYEAAAFAAMDQYRETLNDERRWLLDRYQPIDVALKVVGVGSVGTRCFVMLLQGRDDDDSLILQGKEANESVLERHLGASEYPHHGQRVVAGQRLVQAQPDAFLGWAEGSPHHRHYYVRQLRDWKGSVEIDAASPNQLAFFADIAGRTLARGHARTGDPAAISGYLGGGRKFGKAIVAYAESYADQNRRDYERFLDAISSGRLEASPEP
jgi:uncharacterized protein (DUF2252 family)